MIENRYNFYVPHEMHLDRAYRFINYILKKNNISFYNAGFDFINGCTYLFFTSRADEVLVSKVVAELIFRLNNKEYILFNKEENNDKK